MGRRKKITVLFIFLTVFIAVIGALIAGLIIEGDKLLKIAVTMGVSNVFGAPVEIEYVDLDRPAKKIIMKDFKLYNPEGYTKDVLAYVPDVTIEYGDDVYDHGLVHFRKLDVNLKTMVVIKNEKGAMNINDLRIVKDNLQIKLLIDTLILTADNVIYEDISKGDKADVKEYNVKINNKVFTNITTMEQLGKEILSEIIGKTTIKGVTVWGSAALAGAALAPPIGLPIAAAILMSGNDAATEDYTMSYNDVYNASLEAMEAMGQITSKDSGSGRIRGTVKGVKISINIHSDKDDTHVSVSGRNFLRPNAEEAGGVLYMIDQKLAALEAEKAKQKK